MHIFYTVFIALANNIDNIGARIAYSIRGIKITTGINLWISLITFIISTSAALSGSMISGIISKQMSSIISMVLLTIIGLYIIIESYTNEKKDNHQYSNNISCDDKTFQKILSNPECADLDNSKNIDFKEATLLGIALSINNIGGGISAGMMGLNSIFVGLLSAIISFLALWAGNYLTGLFGKWHLNKIASILSGAILILIGLKQVL